MIQIDESPAAAGRYRCVRARVCLLSVIATGVILLLRVSILAEEPPGPGAAPPVTSPQAEQLFHQRVLPLLKEKCFACHGPDGKGMAPLGSANLTDAVWRFDEEDRLASAKYTITHGVNDVSDPKTREAVMPAFGDRLSADDIKKLAVYVHKFGGGQ